MTANGPSENALFEWYERYVGEPDARTDVYAGFALFFGSIALGVLGLVVFLWSGTVTAGSASYWSLRRMAIVLASLGLPGLMLGIVVLLPVSRRALSAAGAGVAICLIALAVFVVHYPGNWNVHEAADYSAYGIGIYATGLAVVIASTGAALVAHQLERTRPDSAEKPDEETDETVSDERVEHDIEAAMDDVELSWGGVERTETKQLRIDADEEGIDASGFDDAQATTTRATDTSVTDAVTGLQQLQGGRAKSATGTGTDDQTAALSELREKKQANAGTSARRSPFRRALDRVSARFGRD